MTHLKLLPLSLRVLRVSHFGKIIHGYKLSYDDMMFAISDCLGLDSAFSAEL